MVNSLLTGEVVERYTVEAKIGQGGVATVYRVRHNALGSSHALKVVHITAPTIKERLVREGRVQASLRHRNVVAVTDVVVLAGSPGLVMEYIEGPTLYRWMRDERPSLEQAETVFRGILAGMTKAHAMGLVHRDLKPGNVLMQPSDEGGLPTPKIVDFGLAKYLDDRSTMGKTQSGFTMGTPAYMAPEQVRDAKNVDERADIFALGCILYELCTGVSPFERDDLFNVYAALSTGTYPPLEHTGPQLPGRIRNAIHGCLAATRDERIGSCIMLGKVLDGEVTENWNTYTPIDRPARPQSQPPLELSSPGEPPTMIEPIHPTQTSETLWPWVVLAAGGALATMGIVMVALAVVVGTRQLGTPPSVTVTTEPVPFAAPVAADPVPLGPVPRPLPANPVVPTPQPEVHVQIQPQPQLEPMEAGTVEADTPAGSDSTGMVALTGDVGDAWLLGPSGRAEVGEVAPGEYTLWAQFDGGEPQAASRRFVVREGGTVTLACEPAFQMCNPH